MSTDRDVTRIVRSWLEDGATALPDRVLDSVLDQLPTTSQRRAWWPAWRLSEMNTFAKFAVAAAAVVVVAIVGINLLPRSGGIGGSGPSPTPSPSAAPTATPTPTPTATIAGFPGYSDQVAAGTYAWGAGGANPEDIIFTIPEGWISRYGVPHKDRDGPGEMAFGNWIIANVYADPCRWQGSLLDPPVGPTVEDLTIAIGAQKLRNATPPTDVTLGGYSGKRIELSLPANLDITTCDQGVVRFWVAPGEDVANWPTGDPEARSPRAGQVNVAYILDVNGARQVIDTWHMPATSASDLAELETILASMRIGP
jgi:hypothetical protein